MLFIPQPFHSFRHSLPSAATAFLGPVELGRDTEPPFEMGGKVAVGAESELGSYLRYGKIGGEEDLTGRIQLLVQNVFLQADAHLLPEQGGQIVGGAGADFRQFVQRDLIVEVVTEGPP